MRTSWKIPESQIDEMIEQVEEAVYEPFEPVCCTVVAWKLPNGYVLVESSGTIDPSEYSRELGIKFCRERLKTKLWQLEGYVQKCEWAAENDV